MSSIEIFLGGEPLGAAIESLSFERTERANEEVRPVTHGRAEWSAELQVKAPEFETFVEALTRAMPPAPEWPLLMTMPLGLLGDVAFPSRVPESAARADGSVEVEMLRAPLHRAVERVIVSGRYPKGARIDLAAASPRVRAMSRQILGRAYMGERQRRRAMRRLLRAVREA